MLSACVVRRSLLESVGSFREDLHRSQDYEMLIRLSQEAEFQYTGTRTYIIRQHSGLRGPAMNRHSNLDRRRIWQSYDLKIGMSIAKNLPLGRYLPDDPPNVASDPVLYREALLKRAWVMASKAHIEQLNADLLTAATANPAQPQLSYSEIKSCESLPNHPYFLMRIFDSTSCLQPLFSLRKSKTGRFIMNALGKGLYRKAIEKNTDISSLNRIHLIVLATIFIVTSIHILSKSQPQMNIED